MTTPAGSTSESRARLDGVDLVRGAVMIVMLLDHTRDFTHAGALTSDPLDPAQTTPLIYFTRWITHLCAPTFVFLAGLGAGLQLLRGKSAPELARFLWTRGLWLVFLELTVLRALIWFNVNPSLLAHLQVIWAIGLSMILLSALVRLPSTAIGLTGVAIVFGHNLLDRFQATSFRGPDQPLPGPLDQLWMIVHQGGFFPVSTFPGPMVLAQYPILPWAGVLFAGYGAARLYAWPSERRRKVLLALGVAILVGFAALRYSNVYGNPRPWAPGPTIAQTVMAFLNVSKYPPSLLFVLVTLGPSILALGLLEGRQFRGRIGSAVVTFGRVPLFFYMLQWIAAHIAGIVITAAQGKDVGQCFLNLVQIIQLPNPPDVGGPLWTTYLAWFVSTIVLYFPCRWFAQVKARRRDWWLGYL